MDLQYLNLHILRSKKNMTANLECKFMVHSISRECCKGLTWINSKDELPMTPGGLLPSKICIIKDCVWHCSCSKRRLHNKRWQLFTSLYFFSLDQSLYLPVPAIKRKWLNQLIDTNSCTHMPQLYNPMPQEWSFQYCLPLTSKCLSANTSSQFHSKTILWSLTCSSLTLYQDHKLDPIFAMQPLMLQVRGISWENIRKQEICLEETNQQTND